MVTLRKLQEINDERTRLWHAGGKRDWSIAEWTNALCGESGEAANAAKKLLRIGLALPGNESSERPTTTTDTLLNNLGDELADVVIYAAITANVAGLDLENHVKYVFNHKSIQMGFPQRI